MRDGKKFVGTQVILDTDRSPSTGFKTVAVEDSSTLLDNAIAMIEEFCDIYDADNRDHVSAAVRINPKSTSQFPLQEVHGDNEGPAIIAGSRPVVPDDVEGFWYDATRAVTTSPTTATRWGQWNSPTWVWIYSTTV